MNISVFGLGYVGCICLGCLADNGHKVIGVDINDLKVEQINNGRSIIIEEKIDEIIRKQWENGNIYATDDVYQAVSKTEISLICVGTPSTNNGHLDIEAVLKVTEEIANAIKLKDDFHIVVLRSTVLPGTNHKITQLIEELSGKTSGDDFSVVSNPEFLREGSAVADFYSPPFTLLGSVHKKAVTIMEQIYAKIDAPIIITEPKVAEILKYVNNTFHALKIAFANEVGNICKGIGINSHHLMEIFCMDRKLNISSKYLKPGFSYGGSCLPKDLKALQTIAHDLYLDCPVLSNIERSNEVQKSKVLKKIIDFKRKRIGFIGISFKEGTDDLRNSPIIDIIENLIGKGHEIFIFDQNVRLSKLIGANRDYILKKIPYISTLIIEDLKSLINYSDLIIIVNKEAEFIELMDTIPDTKIIYDLVNIGINSENKNYTGISW